MIRLDRNTRCGLSAWGIDTTGIPPEDIDSLLRVLARAGIGELTEEEVDCFRRNRLRIPSALIPGEASSRPQVVEEQSRVWVQVQENGS